MIASSPELRGRWLLVEVSEQTYGLPVSEVREILPMAELAQPIGAPKCLAGILDLGGEPVAVIRFDRLTDRQESSWNLYTPIVVLKSDSPALGLVVDRVSDVVIVRSDECTELPAGYSFNNCAVAQHRRPAGTAVLLSPQRILLQAERRRLDDLLAQQRERLAEESEADL